MAYFDLEDQQLTPEAEAENRRRMLGMLAGSGRTSVLGNQPPPSAPTVPPPRMTPSAPPSLDPSFASKPPLLGPSSQPAKPNVMPQRTDFQEKKLPTWEKVLGIGAAPFVPALSSAILSGPRREAERQYQGATQDWERSQTDAARAATTAETQAKTEALRNPKPEKPENLDREAYDFYVSQGMSPAAARKQVLADAQDQKPDKTPNFEESAYQEWVKTHPGGTRMQFAKEYGAATEKPEKPQKPERTMVAVPQPDGSSKVMEVTPGTVIPKGAQTVQQFGKESTPTADEQRRADLGKNLNENLAAYEDIVRRRPDLFGPIAGRATALKMAAGSPDPDISALRTIKEFAGMAAVGTHAMRNAQHAKIASDAMMNLYDKPEAILAEKGPLARAKASIQTFMGDVEGQRVQDQSKGVNQPIELERGPDGKLRPKNAQR